MGRCELGAVVRLPAGPEQGRGPGMLQMSVVQDRQARKAEQVGPQEVVRGRISELENGQIKRSKAMRPGKIMG